VKKRLTIILSIVALLGLTWFANGVLNAESNEAALKKRMEELRNQSKLTKKRLEEANSNLKQNKKSQDKLRSQINYLDLQVSELQKEIDQLDSEIADTEKKLTEEGVRLDEAIKRVEERDKLLKTRVRAMYENGDVTYLEVLLDSDSIGDFLSRKEMMEKIVDSDKAILEQNIKDKEEIAARKAEIEKLLAALEDKYEKANEMKEQLEAAMKEKSVAVAALEQEEEAIVREKERLDEELKKFAAEISKIDRELSKLKWNGGKLAWPVPDSHNITSRFGTRVHPIKKTRHTHSGIDISAKQGTDIIAAESGKVILASTYGGYGNTVMISHGGGLVTLYAHIRHGGIKVKEGQEVKRGQKIAEVGSTGLSTGPHLHFSVLVDGKYVDPMKYLGK
jgi:murein DD-endopeptidase MepM/ murein hydrolase activator NlpD